MAQWLFELIRKLFLIKEIVSKEGVVHFRRYRLLSTPWFNIYIHNILQSDLDEHPHNHPFNFHSVILKGSYSELSALHPNFNPIRYCTYYVGDVISHKAEDYHKITLNSKSVWTLVFTSGRHQKWGYLTKNGFCAHDQYRFNKNKRKYGVKLTSYSGRSAGWWLYGLDGRFETPSKEEAIQYAAKHREHHPKADFVVEEINWEKEK